MGGEDAARAAGEAAVVMGESASAPAPQNDAADALPPLSSLTCQICKQYFTEPSTLPCLHTFCKSCLETYNGGRTLGQQVLVDDDEDDEDDEEGGAQGEGEGQSRPKRKKVKPVNCPTCKDELQLGSASHYSEPFPNDRMARIVKLLHESKILCQNCEKSASEFRCTVCDAYTCKACWEVTHEAPIFRAHKPERLTHSEMTAPPKCDMHPVNEIEYFCTSDEIGVCQVCLLKGDFKGKDYALLNEVRKQRQDEVERGVSEALLQRARLIEGRKEIEGTLEELGSTLKEQKDAVSANFAEIRKALDLREQETLQALQYLHDTKKTVLDTQVADIDREKGRIEDGVQNVNLVLKHSNDLEVIYLTYVVQEHVNAISDVPSTNPANPDGGADGPDHGPAVDSELPVVLSSKVPQLVRAYASVPDAALVQEIASGAMSSQVLQDNTVSEEQKTILKSVAPQAGQQAEEYGCMIQ